MQDTTNNRRKQILTLNLIEMDAVTIIQDLDPPIIKSTYLETAGSIISRCDQDCDQSR